MTVVTRKGNCYHPSYLYICTCQPAFKRSMKLVLMCTARLKSGYIFTRQFAVHAKTGIVTIAVKMHTIYSTVILQMHT